MTQNSNIWWTPALSECIAEIKAKLERTQEQQRKKRKNKGLMLILVDFESDDEPRSGCTICSL